MLQRLLRPTIIIIAVCAVAVTIWSWATDGIVADLLASSTDAETKLQRLKQFFDEPGPWAPSVYLVFVTIEVVVAPIPGLMLYAPGGILFGATIGGSLALAGNILGAGIACSLTRMLGDGWLTGFIPKEKLERTQAVIESRGGWLIFLLRINPLTSSDVVSYAAGFTRIPIWKVMLSTGCGMAPLCYAQAWLAEGLMTAFPWLVYPLLIACAIYAIAVAVIARKLLLKPA